MALAEWGISDDDPDFDSKMNSLFPSYVRRQKWLAELMARQVSAMLMTGRPAFAFEEPEERKQEMQQATTSRPQAAKPRQKPAVTHERSRSGKPFTRVPAHFLLKQMASRVALTPPS